MRPSISPEEKPRRSSITWPAVTSVTTGAWAMAEVVIDNIRQQDSKKALIPPRAASYPPEVGPIYSLSIHADYQCEHSGVCCTSDWDVAAELPIYRSLDQAMAAGRLVAPAIPAGGSVLILEDLPEDAGAMVAGTAPGDGGF